MRQAFSDRMSADRGGPHAGQDTCATSSSGEIWGGTMLKENSGAGERFYRRLVLEFCFMEEDEPVEQPHGGPDSRAYSRSETATSDLIEKLVRSCSEIHDVCPPKGFE